MTNEEMTNEQMRQMSKWHEPGPLVPSLWRRSTPSRLPLVCARHYTPHREDEQMGVLRPSWPRSGSAARRTASILLALLHPSAGAGRMWPLLPRPPSDREHPARSSAPAWKQWANVTPLAPPPVGPRASCSLFCTRLKAMGECDRLCPPPAGPRASCSLFRTRLEAMGECDRLCPPPVGPRASCSLFRTRLEAMGECDPSCPAPRRTASILLALPHPPGSNG